MIQGTEDLSNEDKLKKHRMFNLQKRPNGVIMIMFRYIKKR